MGGKSYNLNKRNCVHFVMEAAALLGLSVNRNSKFFKKPKSFLFEVMRLPISDINAQNHRMAQGDKLTQHGAPLVVRQVGAHTEGAQRLVAVLLHLVGLLATQHVDQGLSLTLFFKDTATTRDINKAQIYAWRKGIKTIYYIRIRQAALEGTEVENCVSCML